MAEYKEITELPASAQAEDTALTYMRTSLGVDSQVTFAAVREPTLLKANKLSELSPFAQEVRSNLGITNSASTPIGNAAGNLVALGPDGKIPLELLPPSAVGGDGPGEIPNARFLIDQNNLSDVSDKAQARANLGLTETANTPIGENPGDLVQIGIDGKLPPLDLSNGINVPIPDDVMRKDQNLEGLTDLGIARQNLGLGNASQQDETFFVKNSEVGINPNQIVRLNDAAKIPSELIDFPTGGGIDNEVDPLALHKDQNLNDIYDKAIARTNLGLGNIATRSVNEFVQSVLYTTGGSKGTILVGSGIADTIYSRPVGTDGQILTADSTAIDGLAWKDPTSGGGSTDLTAIAGEGLNHFNDKLNVQRDEVTIERDGVSNQLRVKALGIGTNHLAANAVTTDKITDLNVTTAKLADSSVTASKLAAGAITADKIAPNALSDASLADDSIRARHLNPDVVTTNGGLIQNTDGALGVKVDGTTVIVNGTGQLAIAANNAVEVVNDTTPQLGGNLDVQTFSIVSTANQNINLAPNGTGRTVIKNPNLQSQTEAYVDGGSLSGAITLNGSAATVFRITQVGTATYTLTAPAESAGRSFAISLVRTTTASQTTSWNNVKWPSGMMPSLTPSGTDILTFFTLDGGATWYGSMAMKDVR